MSTEPNDYDDAEVDGLGTNADAGSEVDSDSLASTSQAQSSATSHPARPVAGQPEMGGVYRGILGVSGIALGLGLASLGFGLWQNAAHNNDEHVVAQEDATHAQDTTTTVTETVTESATPSGAARPERPGQTDSSGSPVAPGERAPETRDNSDPAQTPPERDSAQNPSHQYPGRQYYDDPAYGVGNGLSAGTGQCGDTGVVVNGQSGPENVYNICAGDTLSHLSLRYGVSVNSIAQSNAIVNPNLIYAGSALRIPTVQVVK